jgi:large subunit ribosomal protein L10
MNRSDKVAVVSGLKEQYAIEGSWLFLVNYSGLNASDTLDLRVELKRSNAGRMLVVKNRLNKIAISDSNFRLLSDHLTGQLAIVRGEDPVAIAKVLHKYIAAGEKIKVLAYSDGKAVYDKNSLEALAKLPPMSLLRAQLLGALLSPATALVRIMRESQSGLVRVLDAHSKKIG